MTSRAIKFPCGVRRISIAWRDGKWSIENEIHLDRMTLPKSYELPKQETGGGLTGSWYEIVDERGEALYRQLLPDPFAGMELFNEDGTISRTEAMAHEATFDVLVPDLPEATSLHLYSSAAPGRHKERHGPEGQAVRVVEFTLRANEDPHHGHE